MIKFHKTEHLLHLIISVIFWLWPIIWIWRTLANAQKNRQNEFYMMRELIDAVNNLNKGEKTNEN